MTVDHADSTPSVETLITTEDFETSRVSQLNLAWSDLKDGMLQWRIWIMLAYQDIGLRYRRSVLGPFWITLSMAITVYSMGYLYSNLFRTDMRHYFPFLVSGILSWSLLSALIVESTDGFLTAQSMKEMKLPYSLHIHRVIARNLLIFFHNILVMIPVFIFFHKEIKIDLCTLFLIPALAIIYLNCLFYGIFLAVLGARYRDIGPVVKSLVQVIFFVTPVMWGPESLTGIKHWIVDLNPFYAFLELIRQPLLGHLPSAANICFAGMMTILGFLMSAHIFIRCRARIIYWL
ncbi:MAG: ABC transporter permease [Gammaproteobacteria bacterium]|nr:ABC transporter permease [Gammaproteobacteria bacterium]